MNKAHVDILRWIHEFSKAQTLYELDDYFRTTEGAMKIYHDTHLITMDEYRELDGRLVTAYYQRYKDICVADYRKADADFVRNLKEGLA